MEPIEPNSSNVLAMIARTKFSPFGETEWETFSGCESLDPLIGETDDGNLIIVDGEKISVITPNGDGEEMFVLKNLS